MINNLIDKIQQKLEGNYDWMIDDRTNTRKCSKCSFSTIRADYIYCPKCAGDIIVDVDNDGREQLKIAITESLKDLGLILVKEN